MRRTTTEHIVAFLQHLAKTLPRPDVYTPLKTYFIDPIKQTVTTLRQVWEYTAHKPEDTLEETQEAIVQSIQEIEQVTWGAYDDVQGDEKDAAFGHTLGRWPGKGPFQSMDTTTSYKPLPTSGSDQLAPLMKRGANKFSDMKQNESVTRPTFRHSEAEEPLSHRSMGTLFKTKEPKKDDEVFSPKAIDVGA